MNRTFQLVIPRTTLFALIATACCSHGVLCAQNEPNLIFIVADDLGSESVQAIDGRNEIFGNEMDCSTGTLKRMAQIGVSFPNCRVNPNCSPTRAGLMTGRRALSTGVTGVLAHFFRGKINPCDPNLEPLEDEWAQATDLTALQTYERTIAEALHDKGYYTVLVDKWHIGGNHVEADGGEGRGLLPAEQGFDFYDLWLDLEDPDPDDPCIYLCKDDEVNTGDEHMVCVAQRAVEAIGERDQGQPYALFFHTITPHRRHLDDDEPDGRRWWEVHDDLLYDTKDSKGFTNSNYDRFRQNVEAIDTVIREELLEELGVITPSGQPNIEFDYDENGEPTVVFFLGDNGTDMEVSWYNSAGGPGDPDTDNHAKSSPYEGGIRVPLIVFGEGVPFNENNPEVDYRLISHLDFFDTLADVAGLTESERVNPSGEGPVLRRHGASFADSIGYDVAIDLGENAYTLSFLGMQEPHHARASFVSNDGYKLIVRGGGTGLGANGLHPMDCDGLGSQCFAHEFYDILPGHDPYEYDNLLADGLEGDELERYLEMRDLVVDYWPLAVSEPNVSVTTANIYEAELFGNDIQTQDLYVLIVQVENGEILPAENNDQFYNDTDDPDWETNVYETLGTESPSVQALYATLRDWAEDLEEAGDLEAASDIRFVDLPLSAALVVSDGGTYDGGFLGVGHEIDDETNEVEHRTFLKFNIDSFDSLVPPGFDMDDLERAQIIMKFEQDSIRFDDPDYTTYWDDDAPTGPIRIHPATVA